ncbi:unnamed protein product [Arctogadus glacialis]
MAETTTTPAKAKRTPKPRKPASHPKYSEMIRQAIESEKARGGSSRQSIQKFIKKNFSVGDNSDLQIKLALKRMEAGGSVRHTRGLGASGSFKLVRGDQDPAQRAAKPKTVRVKKSPVKAAKPKKLAKPMKAPKSPAKPKKSPKSPVKKIKKSPKKVAAPAAKTRKVAAAVKKAKPAKAVKPKPAKKTSKLAKKSAKKTTKKK